MMLDAMTVGSSHTDSMKKICAQANNSVQFSSFVLWMGRELDSVGRRDDTCLEVVLSTKTEDRAPPFSRCVCGIKDLEGVEEGYVKSSKFSGKA